jgi:GTP-binding protein
MFVDRVKIHARAGDGGNGCVSFRREKYVDRGGPDGGDGGKGGDVVLVADKNVGDLSDFSYHPRLIAKRGGHGLGKGCSGRGSPDVVARVPVGTQVFALTPKIRERAASSYHPAAAEDQPALQRGETQPTTEVLTEMPRELIADLVEDGQKFVLAGGGQGGRGNAHFKSSTHRAPREFEYGEPGEELDAELELKTLADVGLVGYPNAGKSTLISKITRAHPKIASYPFTTLTPNVGLIEYPDDYLRIRVADIPGLIEGAHNGRGLGHDFLRHIERCKLLLVVLDMAGVDGHPPQEDYHQLLNELKLYNPDILERPRLIVANKMDLPAAKKNLAAFKRKVAQKSPPSRREAVGETAAQRKIIEISAREGTGLDKLKLALRKALS